MEDTDPVNPVVHTTHYYIQKAKLELLQEIHKTLYPIILSFESIELEMKINNVLSNIHKVHKLGE